MATPMRSSPKLRPGLWDGAVALAVILLAAVCALSLWSGEKGDALTVSILVDGKETERIRTALINSSIDAKRTSLCSAPSRSCSAV